MDSEKRPKTITRKFVVILALAIVAVLSMVSTFLYSMAHVSSIHREMELSYEQEKAISRARTLISRALYESYVTLFLPDKSSLIPSAHAHLEELRTLAALITSFADQPAGNHGPSAITENAAYFALKIDFFRSEIGKILRLYHEGNVAQARGLHHVTRENTIHNILPAFDDDAYLRELSFQRAMKGHEKILVRIRAVNFAIFIFIVALLALLVARLRSQILGPIRELTAATEAIAHSPGRLRKVPVKRRDELGTLASSFNEMADRLHFSMAYADNIIRSTVDVLIVADVAGIIRKVNDNALRLLGYTREEITGLLVGQVLPCCVEPSCDGHAASPCVTAEEATASLLEAIQKDSLKECDCLVVGKDGQNIPVLVSGRSIVEIDGGTTGVLFSAKDARDSKLLLELRKTQQQLVQAAKLASLGELSAGIAHEINQPLFLVQGFAGRIRAVFEKHGKGLPEKASDYLREIQENVERMNRIIRHLRDFSRQGAAELVPVHVNSVIEKSFTLLNEQLRMRNIAVTKELAPSNPRLMGDPLRLEQVFVNILINARDAIDSSPRKGSGRIAVSSRPEGAEIVIELRDNGTGIAPEHQPRVFDPFFTTKRVGEGTGLGLSISHGIIQAHKGSIGCVSTPGEGTTFRITLPALEELEEAEF